MKNQCASDTSVVKIITCETLDTLLMEKSRGGRSISQPRPCLLQA